MHILYEDSMLLLVSKPVGMAVQDDPTGDESLMALAEAHCKHPLHLVHRLDRPVSGLVLLAKNALSMSALSRQWQERTVEKTYLAAVSPAPPKAEDTLVHFVKKPKMKSNKTIISPEAGPDTDRAELHYRTIGHTARYCFLQIELVSGRHHQIRAQLAAIGCPVKGDVKYGARRSNADRSIHLHAWKLSFEHPGSGEWMTWTAPLPGEDAVWQACVQLL
jgi:23S rRNA pseudouridine1911/1915/1917 synthase